MKIFSKFIAILALVLLPVIYTIDVLLHGVESANRDVVNYINGVKQMWRQGM